MASTTISIHHTNPPELNYYDSSTIYHVKNQMTNLQETAYVQDWRSGWKKTGELVGDKLPLIRVSHPTLSLNSYLLRPYHVKDKGDAYICDSTGEKIILFISPLLENKTIEMSKGEGASEVEICALELVYTKPLHNDDASSKTKAEEKKS